ncbi:MAG TPA: ABC transporter substrate-binding protein [Candidatus Onthenecus intestinigallinarum]|uniref:ABC transporter substrate-binding protein n=1 Tax=Candidatus Onthenecus intestinigallinarum TaxID=2840875 RepID=A0A9D0Z9F3_9FIRM|nr:ABC transporter substrate-binding protein [Candidatus Onthenecus intestinigallinarum]
MKKLTAIALCLAMLLMGVSAFAEDAGTINIALIANTTGDYAQYGIPVRNGAMLYIDQLNAAGGINGKQIQVFEYDDKADGIETVNAFNLALENNISAVIGSVLTGATIALSDATYEVNVPQITASATAAGVTVIDPEDPESEVRTNVFRSCFIDPFQGEKMADYAVNKMGAKTAAVLFETGSDYSEGLKDAFVAKAEELGLEIVATEAFATGDRDYRAQMTNIAAQNPDVVFCPIYYGEAGLAITQARQVGITATFLGGDGFGGIKDYATAEDLEGSVYCSGYAPGTESVAQFEADYEATYGEPVPNMFAPLAYDAAMLMCQALKAAEDAGLSAGTPEYHQAVIDALKASDGVEGITGTYTFDEFNNPIKSAAIIQLQGGAENFLEMY